MKKTALYDNPAGYGHGGLGYHHTLDELPTRGRAPGEVPAWLPWVGLAGAGALGYGALRGLGRVFRRGAKAAPKAVNPAAAYELEMMGRVDPRWERMSTQATEAMQQQQARLAREKMFEAEKQISRQNMAQAAPEGANWVSTTLGKTGAAILPALGRIARGD
jgi:hypothetical protein